MELGCQILPSQLPRGTASPWRGSGSDLPFSQVTPVVRNTRTFRHSSGGSQWLGCSPKKNKPKIFVAEKSLLSGESLPGRDKVDVGLVPSPGKQLPVPCVTPPATSQARGTAAGTGAGGALREPFLSTSESRGHCLTAGYLWAPRAQQDRGSLCSAFPGVCLYGNLPSCATGQPSSPCHRTSHGSSSDRTYHPNRKEGAEIWLLAPGQHHPLRTDRNLPK